MAKKSKEETVVEAPESVKAPEPAPAAPKVEEAHPAPPAPKKAAAAAPAPAEAKCPDPNHEALLEVLPGLDKFLGACYNESEHSVVRSNIQAWRKAIGPFLK